MEERFGVGTLIGGLVALVVVATGLSIVAEKRNEFLEKQEQAETDYEANREILAELRDRENELSLKAARAVARKDASERYSSVSKASEANTAKIAELKTRKGELESAVKNIRTASAQYRTSFCDSLWGAAVGEMHEELSVRGGRTYTKVQISKVTRDGLEIRHEFGTARLAADDLPPEWNERFQWKEMQALTGLD